MVRRRIDSSSEEGKTAMRRRGPVSRLKGRKATAPQPPPPKDKELISKESSARVPPLPFGAEGRGNARERGSGGEGGWGEGPITPTTSPSTPTRNVVRNAACRATNTRRLRSCASTSKAPRTRNATGM